MSKQAMSYTESCFLPDIVDANLQVILSRLGRSAKVVIASQSVRMEGSESGFYKCFIAMAFCSKMLLWLADNCAPRPLARPTSLLPVNNLTPQLLVFDGPLRSPMGFQVSSVFSIGGFTRLSNLSIRIVRKGSGRTGLVVSKTRARALAGKAGTRQLIPSWRVGR